MRLRLIWGLDSWGVVDFGPVGAISSFGQPPLCQGGWWWRGQRADQVGPGLKVGDRPAVPDHGVGPGSRMGDHTTHTTTPSRGAGPGPPGQSRVENWVLPSGAGPGPPARSRTLPVPDRVGSQSEPFAREPQGHSPVRCGAGAVPVRRAAAALPLPKSAGASR